MIVSPDILRKETVALIKQIDAQIVEVKAEAQRLHLEPQELRDTSGNWVMNPLLLAKAMAYSTLVQLQSKK